MTDLDSACNKAVQKFLESVNNSEVTDEDVEAFKEDTDYCKNWKKGFKEGVASK